MRASPSALASLLIFANFVTFGCDGEPASGFNSLNNQAGSAGPPGAGPSSGSSGRDSLYMCSGPTQACGCPNGELSGTQNCVAAPSGEVIIGPCSCPAATDATSSGGGELCEALQYQVGCVATTFRSEQLPASVLFVVDRSGSMLCNAPPLQASSDCGVEPIDASMPSKWDTTVDALGATFNALAGSNINAALSFFSADGECATDAAPAVALAALSASHAGVLSSELGAHAPQGRTPIVSALINAYHYMHWDARAGCMSAPCGAPGNRFVILLTDGAESCASAEEQQRLLGETVADARRANIRTFVIGAPGSEPARGFLSELAFRGGTARGDGCVHREDGLGDAGDCHFDMTDTTDFAGDLREALGDIGGSVGCSFGVGGSGSVNVQYTLNGGQAQCVPQSTSLPCEDGAEGWQFAKNADGTDDASRVSICGSACDAIRSDVGAQVDVVLGCRTLMGPQ